MSQSFLPHNEAAWDRGARLVAGFGLLGLGFVLQSWILGLVALVPLLTAVVGSCPAYALLGVSTARRDRASSEGGTGAA